MWLFTKHGFYSIVRHRDHANRFILRGRTVEDVETIRTILTSNNWIDVDEVDTITGTDYLARITINANQLQWLFSYFARSLDYPNFKNAAHDGTTRDATYMQVWSTMRRWQDSAQQIEIPF